MGRGFRLGAVLAGILVAALVAAERLGNVHEDLVAQHAEPLRAPALTELQQIPTSQHEEVATSTPPRRVVTPPLIEARVSTRREPWERVPVDANGESLGVFGMPFRRELVDVVSHEVKQCLEGAAETPLDFSRQTVVRATLLLSIEATETGFDIHNAEILDGTLDAQRQRCLELALSASIDVPGGGGEPGKRYRLELPIVRYSQR